MSDERKQLLPGEVLDKVLPPPQPFVRADQSYGPEQLEKGRGRSLISLATLPGGYPLAPPTGHGWGAKLDAILGGGVCPPYVLTLAASSAGAGKTALVMQLADGLAARSAELEADPATTGPLTPVIVLSEMGLEALTWRSLARWTGRPASTFRAGASAKDAADAFAEARKYLEGPLGRARKWQWHLTGQTDGTAALERIADVVRAARVQALSLNPRREIWPIIIIDPIQRFAGYDQGEIEAVNSMCKALVERVRAEGWIVLLTSDTNKASSTGQGREGPNAKRSPAEEGTAAVRGTYVLVHASDALLYMRRTDDPGADTIEVITVKNRWGIAATNAGLEEATATFAWNGTRMSLDPVGAAQNVTLGSLMPKDKPSPQ